MLKVGMNPYGMTCTMGLLGTATSPLGIEGYVALAEELGSRAIEFDRRHIRKLTDDEATKLRERLAGQEVDAILSTGPPFDASNTYDTGIADARRIGARILRVHLSTILEGARGKMGDSWSGFVAEIRTELKRAAALASVHGLQIAIENHQDFGSTELVEFAEAAGGNVGICLDTGNPFAVGEDPISFTRAVAPKVIHLHLKDYRAQFTDEGYRLVRCDIGVGAVPFAKIYELLGGAESMLTATVEPGALFARHIRLFAEDWWTNYSERPATRLAECLRQVRPNHLPEDADYRTPFELGQAHDDVAAFEVAQVRRSFDNVRSWGWL